ncbi:hypothetical protein GON03_02925 [Nocardioides sp. MAH-18]|uniref:VOC domain-containing protein n=1 Tax=Nocardioides agri TaxID=2682843 RepID=A0A6L6XLK1_9ACTN|nr:MULTISPECIES: VOC family protein [unclassified Nocardioides]MBA2953251.1 VOC family protein [Nocardioides sp. CGMCC 1.13656]MVQ48119.1 hypothetical protein [Nocardioides sp. MAH-18]
MTEPRVVALNHVGVSVADLDRARSFWSSLGAVDHDCFSWPVGTAPADESLATAGTAASVSILRTDAAFLELFSFASPTPAPLPAGAPGVAGLVWAVPPGTATGGVTCPDGTPVSLVEAGDGPRGLVGVRVRVADPDAHPLPPVPGPVEVVVDGGADVAPARPVDLGVNHLCLDVAGIAGMRSSLAAGVRWHHGVTESSGGIAAVCYGTTHDGVLVELLESRSDDAFLARCRLAR